MGDGIPVRVDWGRELREFAEDVASDGLHGESGGYLNALLGQSVDGAKTPRKVARNLP